jgi:hypothetical protein
VCVLRSEGIGLRHPAGGATIHAMPLSLVLVPAALPDEVCDVVPVPESPPDAGTGEAPGEGWGKVAIRWRIRPLNGTGLSSR